MSIGSPATYAGCIADGGHERDMIMGDLLNGSSRKDLKNLQRSPGIKIVPLLYSDKQLACRQSPWWHQVIDGTS